MRTEEEIYKKICRFLIFISSCRSTLHEIPAFFYKLKAYFIMIVFLVIKKHAKKSFLYTNTPKL